MYVAHIGIKLVTSLNPYLATYELIRYVWRVACSSSMKALRGVYVLGALKLMAKIKRQLARNDASPRLAWARHFAIEIDRINLLWHVCMYAREKFLALKLYACWATAHDGFFCHVNNRGIKSTRGKTYHGSWCQARHHSRRLSLVAGRSQRRVSALHGIQRSVV